VLYVKNDDSSLPSWTMRVRDQKGNYYDDAGNIVSNDASASYIPYNEKKVGDLDVASAYREVAFGRFTNSSKTNTASSYTALREFVDNPEFNVDAKFAAEAYDALYGKAYAPKLVKEFEKVNEKVIVNPDLQIPSVSNKLKVSTAVGKQERAYIWAIDEKGSLRIGSEANVGTGMWLGHPTLTDGLPARIAGELKYDDVRKKWIINQSSGRYTWPYKDRGIEQLSNAAELFNKYGLDVEIEFLP
jgi:hypothetical protein